MRWSAPMRCLTVGILLMVICFIGFHWRLDFNLDSGRERICQCLFNFAFWRGESKETVISKALGKRNDGGEWLQVRDGPHFFSCVYPSYPRMLGRFDLTLGQFEILEIRDARLPRELAEWVMEDLQSGRDCYWAWQRMERFGRLLSEAVEQDDDSNLVFDQVRFTWQKAKDTGENR